jgi:hypothetical protein
MLVVSLGVALFFGGLLAHGFGVGAAGIVTAVAGLLLFVVASCWRAAHPDKPLLWPNPEYSASNSW